MTSRAPTPSQTVGPFFDIGFRWFAGSELVAPDHPAAVRIEGQVLDAKGDPVPDAVVEIFQADADGRFPPDTDPRWTGFGRSLTDELGAYRFVTVKPGPVAEGLAPHVDMSIFARGLLQRLVTRCYFGDEVERNASDPLLEQVGPTAAATLVAPLHDGTYRFDLHLQGDQETAFFAW